MPDAEGAGEFPGVGKLAGRIGLGNCRDGNEVRPHDLRRRFEKQGAVNAAGKGDHRESHLAEQGEETIPFLFN
jgi:hypothetical protein